MINAEPQSQIRMHLLDGTRLNNSRQNVGKTRIVRTCCAVVNTLSILAVPYFPLKHD